MNGIVRENILEMIDRFNIPLDEYPRRCIRQIAEWEQRRDELTMDPHLQSELSIDDIVHLCDDLIAAHEGWLPKYE